MCGPTSRVSNVAMVLDVGEHRSELRTYESSSESSSNGNHYLVRIDVRISKCIDPDCKTDSTQPSPTLRHLFPGDALNKTKEVLCLLAVCALRNASRCDRKIGRARGRVERWMPSDRVEVVRGRWRGPPR